MPEEGILVFGDELPEEPGCGVLHCSPSSMVEAVGDDSNAGWGGGGRTASLMTETAGSVVGDGDVEVHP